MFWCLWCYPLPNASQLIHSPEPNMYSVRVHTVDTAQPLFTTTSPAAAYGHRTPNNIDLRIIELRGRVHLFRHFPPPSSSSTSYSSLSNPSARTTRLFVAAVPNYLSSDDFLLFCGSQLDHFLELLFLRNDAIEDRYSVLIKLASQVDADGFYCCFNGKRFRLSEAEVCHIYFTQSVEYADSAEFASTPPLGCTELPTCPVCLERLDQDTSGIQSTLCDHSFQCSCVSKWTYLSCQVCRLGHQHDEKPTCVVCGTLKNLWVCVICGFVGCGRYEQGHAHRHWSEAQHCYSLELETQQIWDYVGDKYVHRLNQSKVYGKPVMLNSHCKSLEGECASCGYTEDSGIGNALFSSKVDVIFDEYNHLLATQLETQRQHYESLLAEAKNEKERSVSKAVEKAVFSRMQELQDKIGQCIERKKAVADKNQKLVKKNEALQKKFKEIEEREKASLKSRDDKIMDLKEQIRDLRIYVQAQRTLSNTADSESIRGGTLLPVQSSQSSGNSKRRTKVGRRRN